MQSNRCALSNIIIGPPPLCVCVCVYKGAAADSVVTTDQALQNFYLVVKSHHWSKKALELSKSQREFGRWSGFSFRKEFKLMKLLRYHFRNVKQTYWRNVWTCCSVLDYRRVMPSKYLHNTTLWLVFFCWLNGKIVNFITAIL